MESSAVSEVLPSANRLSLTAGDLQLGCVPWFSKRGLRLESPYAPPNYEHFLIISRAACTPAHR